MFDCVANPYVIAYGVLSTTRKGGCDGVFSDAFAQSMMLPGTIFGKEERAAALVSFIAAEKDDISSRIAVIAATE